MTGEDIVYLIQPRAYLLVAQRDQNLQCPGLGESNR